MPGQHSNRSELLEIKEKELDELPQTYAYIAKQNEYALSRKQLDEDLKRKKNGFATRKEVFEKQLKNANQNKKTEINLAIQKINNEEKQAALQYERKATKIPEPDKINTVAQLNSATGLCELWGDRITQEDAADARVLSEPALTWELLGKELREKALVNTVSTLENILKQKKQDQGRGSTLCASVIGFGKITTANVGDSAAILVYWDDKGKVQFKRMGHSHCIEVIDANKEKKDLFYTEEWKRIQNDIYEADDESLRLPNRINMSRSMGDNQKFLKDHPNFVNCHQAEIAETDIPVSQHAFLVTACDGLTDEFTDQEIAAFVQDHVTKNPNATTQDIATALAKAAYDKGSVDNITVLVSNVKQIQKRGELHAVSVFDGHGSVRGHEPAQTLRENFLLALKKNLQVSIDEAVKTRPSFACHHAMSELKTELGLKQNKKIENEKINNGKNANGSNDSILIPEGDGNSSEEESISDTEEFEQSQSQNQNQASEKSNNKSDQAESPLLEADTPSESQADTPSENIDLLGQAGNIFLKEIESIITSKEFEISDLPILTECIQNVKGLIQSIRAMSQEDEKTPLKQGENATRKESKENENTLSLHNDTQKNTSSNHAKKIEAINSSLKNCFDSIQKIQNLNRSWSKRLAQTALIVAGVALISLAVIVAVATLGGATPLAVLAIPLAGALLKAVAVGAVMTAGAVSASGMGMFAIKMGDQKPPIQETMETVDRKAREFTKSQLPKK